MNKRGLFFTGLKKWRRKKLNMLRGSQIHWMNFKKISRWSKKVLRKSKWFWKRNLELIKCLNNIQICRIRLMFCMDWLEGLFCWLLWFWFVWLEEVGRRKRKVEIKMREMIRVRFLKRRKNNRMDNLLRLWQFRKLL